MTAEDFKNRVKAFLTEVTDVDSMIAAIGKDLHVTDDDTVSLSDMEGVVRKIVLEASGHGKRTETLTKEKPTDGAPDEPRKLPSAEETFQKMLKKKKAL